MAQFTPRPEPTANPGFVYGGLIASLINFHPLGTAAAASARAQGRGIGDAPAAALVTASLRGEFLAPTPLAPELDVQAGAVEVGARKVIVHAAVTAAGAVTARGELVVARMPDPMEQPGRRGG